MIGADGEVCVCRVPYLDPSFEALVKIQLRFCAEAYSRMAQVQQYVHSSLFGCLWLRTELTCSFCVQIPRCFDTRSVCLWGSGCEGGGCAGADTGVEYCWDGLRSGHAGFVTISIMGV